MTSLVRGFVVFALLLVGAAAEGNNGDDSSALGSVLHIDGGNEFGWDQDSWYVQVDGVMGGRSSGDLEFLVVDAPTTPGDNNSNSNNVLKFTGEINLTGGGFSSVRRRVDLDLSDYAGVVMTLRADPHDRLAPIAPTGLHLQLGDATSFYDFSSALAVPLSSSSSDTTGIWTSVYLPVETFDRGTRVGFVCNSNNNDCRFDPSEIDGMSVFVLFQEGDFDVRIESIEAVTEPRSFSPPVLSDLESAQEVVDLLLATVDSGGGLYDKSYVELCVAMYWSVLNTLLAVPSPSPPDGAPFSGYRVPDPVKVVICAGLELAESTIFSPDTTAASNNNNNNRKQAAAWTLRYTIDAVVADLRGSDRAASSSNSNDLGWLPSPAEAESMDVTCVGRTSPAPGILYNPTSSMDDGVPVLYVDDDDGGVEGGANDTATATTALDDPVEESVVRNSVSVPDSAMSSGASASKHRSLPVWALLVAAVLVHCA